MNARTLLAAALLAALVASGCRSAKPREVIVLSTARLAGDFDTYALRRVGLMPVEGVLDADGAVALQGALYAELSRSTPYELVQLAAADLSEVRAGDPVRKGAHRPDALVEISRRFRLDGLVFTNVPRHRHYPPLELSLRTELVATETGQVIWTSSVHLDATDERVRHGLEGYYAREAKAEKGAPGWELSLLSPTRFARFAAYQIALQL